MQPLPGCQAACLDACLPATGIRGSEGGYNPWLSVKMPWTYGLYTYIFPSNSVFLLTELCVVEWWNEENRGGRRRENRVWGLGVIYTHIHLSTPNDVVFSLLLYFCVAESELLLLNEMDRTELRKPRERKTISNRLSHERAPYPLVTTPVPSHPIVVVAKGQEKFRGRRAVLIIVPFLPQKIFQYFIAPIRWV